MPIVFKSRLFHQKILDPNNNFEPALIPNEVRWDTLTGRGCIIQEFRFRGQLPKPDYSALVEKTQPLCPFCSPRLETLSPRFPPEFIAGGHLRHKGVTVVPNFNPYAAYSAIAVLSPVHFLELPQFNEEIVVNGLLAAQDYLRRVATHDKLAKYMSVNCNYLPPAGGSVIHAHFQPIAGYTAPTYEREALAALKNYHRKNGTSYWVDLMRAEKEKGERFIADIGVTSWLMNFACRGRDPDILIIFRGKHSILDLAGSDCADFYDGLRRVFLYMVDRNCGPFNMALYSAPPGADQFWAHARFKLRFQFPPLGTADYCFVEALHDDFLCQAYPEAICRELKPYFGATVGGEVAAGD